MPRQARGDFALIPLDLAQSGLERFLAKVERASSTECWNWTGRLDKDGYGSFSWQRDGVEYTARAHRASRLLLAGIRTPNDVVLRHSCDNARCVNPVHVVDGTHALNVQDKMERGRHRNGTTRLSPADRAEIRSSRERPSVLAARYGVTASAIAKVRRKVGYQERIAAGIA